MGSASQSLGAAKALDPPSLLDRDDPRAHKGQTELGMSTPEIGRFEAKVGLRRSQFGRQSRSVLRRWIFPKSRPQHTLHQEYYSVIEAVPRGTIPSLKFRIHHKVGVSKSTKIYRILGIVQEPTTRRTFKEIRGCSYLNLVPGTPSETLYYLLRSNRQE